MTTGPSGSASWHSECSERLADGGMGVPSHMALSSSVLSHSSCVHLLKSMSAH